MSSPICKLVYWVAIISHRFITPELIPPMVLDVMSGHVNGRK